MTIKARERGRALALSCSTALVLLLIGGHLTEGYAQNPAGPPPISGQVTFLYYKDLDGAAEFYGQVLGLKRTMDLDWVKMFQLSPTSKVGLVSATGGTHRPSEDKPVMVSLVVEDVDAWYDFVKSKGVEVPNPPKDSARSGVRSFGFKDAEGYTLEVFAWLKK